MGKPAYILMDIEGTTTSIHFVHEVLFPYSAKHLSEFIAKHSDEANVKACLTEAREIIKQEEGHFLSQDEVVAKLQQWIHEDRKVRPLKSLQGFLWKEGYEKQAYKAHLYEDVLPKLKEWRANGIKLAIYSSGSVEAQKLLFSHTEHGDITPLISAYFDTKVGHKRDSASYHQIVLELGVSPKDVLFLSDVIAELNAANAAGLASAHIVRPGTKDQSYNPSFTQFDLITF